MDEKTKAPQPAPPDASQRMSDSLVYLPCGHGKWDTRIDCIPCLRFTVEQLNQTLTNERIERTQAAQPQPASTGGDGALREDWPTQDYIDDLSLVTEIGSVFGHRQPSDGAWQEQLNLISEIVTKRRNARRAVLRSSSSPVARTDYNEPLESAAPQPASSCCLCGNQGTKTICQDCMVRLATARDAAPQPAPVLRLGGWALREALMAAIEKLPEYYCEAHENAVLLSYKDVRNVIETALRSSSSPVAPTSCICTKYNEWRSECPTHGNAFATPSETPE